MLSIRIRHVVCATCSGKSMSVQNDLSWLRRLLAVLFLAIGVLGMNDSIAATADDAFRQTEADLRLELASAQRDSGADSAAAATAMERLALHIRVDTARSLELLALVERLEQIDARVFGPEHKKVAFALQWQGLILYFLGDAREALHRLERSLAIYESETEDSAEWIAIVLSRTATVRSQLGDLQGALTDTTRALSISESLLPADDYRVGIAHNNLGTTLKNLGMYAQAIKHYEKALTIASNALGESDRRVTPIIGNLGVLYLALGDMSSAEAMFKRRLQLVEQRADTQSDELGYAWNDLAHLHQEAGQYSLAVQEYERSWRLIDQSQEVDSAAKATSLNNQAVVQAKLRNFAEAAHLHERALTLREQRQGQDSVDVALSLTNLAISRTDGRMKAEDSLPLLFRAIRIYSAAGRREGLWQTQNTLRQVYQQIGSNDLAVIWGKEAVNTLQSLRAELLPLSGGLQSSFIENKSDVYQQLASLLIFLGRIEEAQQVIEAVKEYELFVDLDQRAGLPARFADVPFTERERIAFQRFSVLRDELAALGSERRQLEVLERTGRLGPTQASRLAELVQRRIPDAEQAMLSFLKQLEQQELGATEAPSLATRGSRLRMAVEALSISEPQANAVGLQYSMTNDTLSVILTAAGSSPVAQQIAIDREQLRRQVGELQLLLANPASSRARVEAALVALHGVLFGPKIVRSIKQLGARTLMLSLDDVLRYVPFAALTDGQRYVVEDYVLSVYNEATTNMLLSSKAPVVSRVAAFGMSQAVGDLPPLKAVPSELQHVVRQSNTTGTIWLDKAFDRQSFQSSLQAQFNVLHVASHFVLKSGRPDLSSLILGDGNRLTLADFSRDNLRFDAFDLVALSACQTGVGGGLDAIGREVESLGSKAQLQGAHAVLATLWRVSDGSTAEFMNHFYRARSSGRLNTAEALRDAQLRYISTSIGKEKAKYTGPYFWAPFVLMGNWR